MSEWTDQIEHYRLRFEALESRLKAGDPDALSLLAEIRAELDAFLSSQPAPAQTQLERDLLASITDGLFALDRDWQFTFINNRAAENAGFSPEQLLHQYFWDQFPQYAGTEMEQVFRRVMNGGGPEHFELPGSDGRFYDVRVFPTLNGISIYWTDQSGQKRLEMERDENIERLGQLVEISARILACKTPGEVLDTVAREALDLIGARSALTFYRTPEGLTFDACAGEAAGGSPEGHFEVEKGGVYQNLLARPGTLRLKRGQLQSANGWWGLPEDHFLLDDLLGSSLTDAAGESSGMLLVTGKQAGDFSIEDEYLITQITHLASLALQNLQSTLQARVHAAELDAIFLSTSDALIVYDRQGAVLRANPAARHLFGEAYPSMKPAGARDRGASELFMPGGGPIDPETLPTAAAMRTQKPTGWNQFHCHLPDGRRIELNVSGSPLYDESGQYAGAVTVWHDITDLEQARRRAEQEANRAGLLAEELNSIFAAMTDGVMVFDPQGNPVRLNPAARELYQFEVTQSPLEETMTRINLRHMDGRPFAVEELPSRRALRGELVLGEPAVQIRPDGKDQTIISSAAPIFDSSGRITGSVVVWHDISEAEQIHQQYRRQREVLERIIEQAPIGITLLDGPEHRYSLANKMMYTISRGKGEIIGRTPAEVWPEAAHQFVPILDQVYRTGERYQIQNLLMRLDRDRGPEEVYFSYTYTPILGLDGQVESILALLWETTEEVQSRRGLERERAFLRTVIESAPMAIVIADASGHVLVTNPAADRIYNRPVPYGRDYSSHADLRICHPDGTPYEPRDLPLTRSALDGETHTNVDMAIVWPDGQVRSLVVNSAPIINTSGERIGAVSIFEDVTDYRRSIGHDRFLAELGQDLLLQTQPEAIFSLITGRLRCHLNAGRVMLNEINLASGEITVHEDHQEDLPPLPEPYTLNLFPARLLDSFQRGQPVWSEDVLEDERFGEAGEELARNGFRAIAMLPRKKVSQAIQSLNVSSAVPRQWREDELALIGSVADLAWLALERSRLLQDLQTSEQRYRRLFESNIIGVTYSYLDGPVVQANDAFLAITGYSRQDLESGAIDWRRLTPPEYLALDNQAVSESMERGRCSPFEKEYLRKDGSRVPVMIGFSPLDETATQFVCFVLDMSEQKHYRDALRESQKRLDLALRGSPVIMFTQDTRLRYTWIFNPHPVFAGESSIGHTDEELLPPEDAAVLTAIKREVIASREGLRKDVTLHVDGELVIYDLTVEPQTNERGEVIGIVCVAVDVTERYRLEGEMRHKAAQVEVQRTILQHREQERMQIARDLHDGLLQELVGISFGLGEVASHPGGEASQMQLQKMRDTLNHQIQELRDFCTDLRPPSLAPFGVEKALRAFIITIQERNPDLKIHLDLMRDGKTLNEVVRLTIFRICQELLNNVTRHAQAGNVWVRFQFSPERVSLEVRDDGQGFQPPDRWIYLAREGHFGLVGIQERVEAVNGRMEMESAPGKGARVAVSIPLKNNPAIEGKFDL